MDTKFGLVHHLVEESTSQTICSERHVLFSFSLHIFQASHSRHSKNILEISSSALHYTTPTQVHHQKNIHYGISYHRPNLPRLRVLLPIQPRPPCILPFQPLLFHPGAGQHVRPKRHTLHPLIPPPPDLPPPQPQRPRHISESQPHPLHRSSHSTGTKIHATSLSKHLKQ